MFISFVAGRPLTKMKPGHHHIWEGPFLTCGSLGTRPVVTKLKGILRLRNYRRLWSPLEEKLEELQKVNSGDVER